MPYRHFIALASFLVIAFIYLLSGSGCANIIPPAGGPRDSIPPLLVKASPADSTRNFSGSRITFSFNEFVEVQNPQENLVVSPLAKNSPLVDYRLNTVTIKLKDTLEPNTTYHINFGDAIRDFTEGNVLKKFTYTFSTGPYIDSLEITGKVLLAETGKTDTTLILMLHTSPDDSAVVKDRPRYIAKQDGRGNFIFKNLPPRTFYLYALKDDGGTRRYFNDKQLFAFASKPIVTGAKNEPVTLYAYSVKPAPTGPSGIPSLSFGGRPKGGAASDKRLKYLTSISGTHHDLLTGFSMTFDTPLRSFDSTKMRLYTDSAYKDPGTYRFSADITMKTIRLTHEWKENTLYHIILEKDFAEDTSGKKLLKTDTLHFVTKKKGDYGSLKLRLKNLDISQNPVLLIMNGETIYKSYPMTSIEISQPLFLPGEYELRILYDENKNGKWDPGEFFGKHKQPEIVRPVDRKISVKPNFQNEVEITL